MLSPSSDDEHQTDDQKFIAALLLCACSSTYWLRWWYLRRGALKGLALAGSNRGVIERLLTNLDKVLVKAAPCCRGGAAVVGPFW